MKEARYLYKCRKCGGIDDSAASSVELSMNQTVDIVLGVPTKGIPLTMIGTHVCKDGGYGVTDFIGTKVVETEE